MTLQRLTRLLKNLPPKFGVGNSAARSGRRRHRVQPAAVESLEQRLLLTQVTVDVSLADAVPAADVAAEALKDGRALQATNTEGRLLYVVGDQVRLIELEVSDSAAGTAESDWLIGRNLTFDLGPQELKSADGLPETRIERVDSPLGDSINIADGAVGSAELVGFDSVDDSLEPNSVRASLSRETEVFHGGHAECYGISTDLVGQGIASEPAAVTTDFDRTLERPIATVVDTSPQPSGRLLSQTGADVSFDSSGPATVSDSAPTVVGQQQFQQVVGTQPLRNPVALEPNSADVSEPFEIILNIDAELAEVLGKAELRDVVSSVRTYVVNTSAPQARGVRFVFRTTMPRHRASSFRQAIVSPIARIQQETKVRPFSFARDVVRRQSQQVANPNVVRLSAVAAKAKKSPVLIATSAPRAQNYEVAGNQAFVDQAAALQSAPSNRSVAPLADGIQFGDNELAENDSVVPPASNDSSAITMDVFFADFEDSLIEIRSVARPVYAVLVRSSNADDRTQSEFIDTRLAAAQVGAAGPVEIERPLAPAIESLVLKQLEFETAPRGPPLSEAVAQGFVSNRAVELRLRLLRHSQAPRSPSMVLAN